MFQFLDRLGLSGWEFCVVTAVLPKDAGFRTINCGRRGISGNITQLVRVRGFNSLKAFRGPAPDRLINCLRGCDSRGDEVGGPRFRMTVSYGKRRVSRSRLLSFTRRCLGRVKCKRSNRPLLICSRCSARGARLRVIASEITPSKEGVRRDRRHEHSRRIVSHVLKGSEGGGARGSVSTTGRCAFSSLTRFGTVVISVKCRTCRGSGGVFIGRNKGIRGRVPFARVRDLFGDNCQREAHYHRLEDVLGGCHSMDSGGRRLRGRLGAGFNVSVIFFNGGSTPCKCVLISRTGGAIVRNTEILTMRRLLSFTAPRRQFGQVRSCVSQLLALGPGVARDRVCDGVGGRHTCVGGNVVCFSNREHPLGPFVTRTVSHGGHVTVIRVFGPTARTRQSLLYGVFGISQASLMSVSPREARCCASTIGRLHRVFGSRAISSIEDQLRRRNFAVHRRRSTACTVGFGRRVVVGLARREFGLRQLEGRPMGRVRQRGRLRPAGPTSHFSNGTGLRSTNNNDRDRGHR